MTQKLKILGSYTPEHKGPFCTRDGRSVRILTKTEGTPDLPMVAVVEGYNSARSFSKQGHYIDVGATGCLPSPLDLMNAKEVPQPREFWVNEYSWGFGPLVTSCEEAMQGKDLCRYIRTIHVREVLPGEGE